MTCIVEQKESRLLRGQADGIACRTMEMFDLGFSERAKLKLLDQRDRVRKPDEKQAENIVRSGRVQTSKTGCRSSRASF